MASSENIPTKLDVSVIIGKVRSQCSAWCYINHHFDSVINRRALDIFVRALQHLCPGTTTSLSRHNDISSGRIDISSWASTSSHML
jgi:hypothetical protein